MKKSFLFVVSIMLFGIFLLAGCSNKERGKEEVNALKEIEGNWEGSIQVPNQPLAISVLFAEEKGTIDIPIQGISDYPLNNISFEKPSIKFEMNIQGQKITFEGTHENKKITGTFAQQGQSFPFELFEGDTKEISKQNIVEIMVSGGKMKGQLEIPEGEGPFPLMIIIAGSGPTDKDGNSIVMGGKNNSLKMVAESLADNGIASIRYDKRGVAMNAVLGGKEEDLRFNNFVEDAESWVEYAKGDKRFSTVGIIGHSEGSLVGIAAADSVDIFISLAGAGRPIDEVLVEQLQAQLPATLLEESLLILQQLKQGKQVEELSPELHNLFRPSVQPYMISWLTYHPANMLKELDIPVLVVNGDRDIQVPTKDANLLHEAKPDSKLLIIPGMNHVLKEAPEDREGNIATYTKPDLPLARGLMEEIVEFIQDIEKR